MAEKEVKRHWTVVAVNPPVLTSQQWLYSSLVGLIFLILAIVQLTNYADFRDNFTIQSSSALGSWSALIIFAELWAAAGFFNVKLSPLFRKVSNFWAYLVALFWFFWAAYLWTQVFTLNANFFANRITQRPSFWTLLESALFLGFVLYILNIMKTRQAATLPSVSIMNKKRRK